MGHMRWVLNGLVIQKIRSVEENLSRSGKKPVQRPWRQEMEHHLQSIGKRTVCSIECTEGNCVLTYSAWKQEDIWWTLLKKSSLVNWILPKPTKDRNLWSVTSQGYMCLCLFVYLSLCVCESLIHLCVYICVSAYPVWSVCICMSVNLCGRVCVCVYVYVSVCLYVRTEG